MNDGLYVELFAVKNGARYNAKTVDLKDVMREMNNGLMDSIENLW